MTGECVQPATPHVSVVQGLWSSQLAAVHVVPLLDAPPWDEARPDEDGGAPDDGAGLDDEERPEATPLLEDARDDPINEPPPEDEERPEDGATEDDTPTGPLETRASLVAPWLDASEDAHNPPTHAPPPGQSPAVAHTRTHWAPTQRWSAAQVTPPHVSCRVGWTHPASIQALAAKGNTQRHGLLTTSPMCAEPTRVARRTSRRFVKAARVA